MKMLHVAVLAVTLWGGRSAAQERSKTAPVVPANTTNGGFTPVWKCETNTDNGCFLTLLSGQTLVGFPIKVVPNDRVMLRLFSGVRRVYALGRDQGRSLGSRGSAPDETFGRNASIRVGSGAIAKAG